MRQRFPRKVKPGDAIKADDWNYLIDLICRNSPDVDASSGILMRQGPGGTAFTIADEGLSDSYVGVVGTAGITARSGTTPGSGPVLLYVLKRSGPTLVSNGADITAYSFSSTTGGIPSGTYVFVQQDAAGVWWITSVDCGN